MVLKECIMTNSTCYTGQLEEGYYHWSRHKNKVGIVVHSTGANNPNLKRYVQPSDNDVNYDAIIADIGKNTSGIDWNHKYREAGVHAFIGLNAKGNVETYQVLPYEWGAWGVGKGSKGSYNFAPTAHIQFEICEDNLKDESYFNKVFKEAIEYCAYLCKKFGWNSHVICSHAESHARGYGGNHADCDHWLKRYGKTMDWFRAEVQKLLDAKEQKETETKIEYTEYVVQKGDNLSKIAKKFGTTVNAIAEANGIVNKNLIHIGDELMIPVSKNVSVEAEIKPSVTIKVGDKVKVRAGIKTYANGKKMASWVADATLYVRQIEKDGAIYLVSTQATGNSYTGRFNSTDVEKI